MTTRNDIQPGPTVTGNRLRAVEFFGGIGGFAAAAAGKLDIVSTVDINEIGQRVSRLNFDHPTITRTIESLSADQVDQWKADVWWMSPPCQPFTRRGNQRDLDDPRCAAFKSLVQRLKTIRPAWLLLENVPEFQTSRARNWLVDALESGNYSYREHIVCPTELGIPARRRRYYLLATEGSLPVVDWSLRMRMTFAELLPNAADIDFRLWQLDPAVVEAYGPALDLVDIQSDAAVTACFTSAYGRSFVRSGSYVREARGVRYFTPREILSTLGFATQFQLPDDLTREQAWRLVGNSLSIFVVERLIEAVCGVAVCE